jgi:hypothetical protein
MPLLLPVSRYDLNWFYPALMILLGAHYLPFVFLYGMRMFALLAAALLGGGIIIAMYLSSGFSTGAWYTGTTPRSPQLLEDRLGNRRSKLSS